MKKKELLKQLYDKEEENLRLKNNKEYLEKQKQGYEKELKIATWLYWKKCNKSSSDPVSVPEGELVLPAAALLNSKFRVKDIRKHLDNLGRPNVYEEFALWQYSSFLGYYLMNITRIGESFMLKADPLYYADTHSCVGCGGPHSILSLEDVNLVINMEEKK